MGEIKLIFDENGVAHEYDDTYDIIIHAGGRELISIETMVA